MSNERGGAGTLSRREFLSRTALAAGAVSAAAAVAGGLGEAMTGGAAGATPRSSALTSMSLQLPWLENAQAAGEFIAESEGYYRKNGLNVKLLSGGPNVSIEPVVTAGTALVGLSSADVCARARHEGAPLKIIGAQYQKNPYAVISPANKPIVSPRGLIGKSIGVSASNLTVYELMLKINNIDESKVTRVPVQFDPTPLVNGEVDAWLGYITSDAVTLVLKNFPIHSFLLSNFGYHIWGDVYETTEEAIAKKRSTLVAFLRAERQGWARDFKDFALGDSLVLKKYGKNLGLSAKQELLQSKQQVALMLTPTTKSHGLFWMSDAGIAQNLATIRLTGIPAARNMFDNSLLQEL